MCAKYKAVLFDLDGTLTNSVEGIKKGLEYAVEKMGLPDVDLSNHSKFIGPPLLHTIENVLCVPKDRVDEAADIYREYYNEKGMYENKIYCGVERLLAGLKKKGVRLAVATSKFQKSAEEVLEDIGIDSFFDVVCGSGADEKSADKAVIILNAVKELGMAKNMDGVVLIGDTKYDAEGAKRAGCDFIGVTYGFGSIEEMEEHGAKKFVDSTDDLLSLLVT